MTVSEILMSRSSCRGFKDEIVSDELLKEIFSAAQQVPSNCNVQPWKVFVVSGEKKDQLKKELVETVIQKQIPNPDFDWNTRYEGIHRERQFGSAAALYSSMDISRDDKQKRQIALLRNWDFFDAPHVAIFTMDKYLGITGAVDIGIYAQTLSLLLEERSISSCMQGALGQFPDPIHKMLNMSDESGVLFGMSFGYCDESVSANSTRTERAQLDDAVSFIQ